MSKFRKQVKLNHELVGRRVLCINDDFSNAPPLRRIIFKFPKRGIVYTIREVYDESLHLNEIVNPVAWFPDHGGVICEVSFDKPRFMFLDKVSESVLDNECVSISEKIA